MHIDAFDELFDTAEPPATRAAEYAPIPEGRAEVEIIAASIGYVAWKASDANPRGTCLKLRLSAGRGYAFVFADLPRNRTALFRALATALGIAPDSARKVSLPKPEELVGRTVAVEIGHFKTRAGATKAGVKKWLPPAAPPRTTRAKPASTKPRGADRPVDLDPDDIPF